MRRALSPTVRAVRAVRIVRFATTTATLLVALAACKVKLIDAYNKEAEEGLLQAYGKVESLFDALAEAPAADRAYTRYADRYAGILELIRVQELRESARPLNHESFGIIAIIDTVF